MDEEARGRLLSLFIEEKDPRSQAGETREMDQLERERDCGEGLSSSKVEPVSHCKLERSSDTESISVSSDSEIECSVEESEYSSEESDDSDCSSQVSVIMRAPKTAVLNWLKGIEVSEDKKVKGANETGNPRQHSHDREADDTTGEETAVLTWLRGIQRDETNGSSRANQQAGNLTQHASDGDEDASREKCRNPSDSHSERETANSKIENGFAISQKYKSPCNHQNSFDFVEEEMTFIINVMPEEPTFEPIYKKHSEELSLPADFTSEPPLTTFAPHHFDKTPESSLAIECKEEEDERQLYKKENKKPSSLVEKRLSCINEEDESQQRQQLESETVGLPKKMQMDGGDEEAKKSCIEGEEMCDFPEVEEKDTKEGNKRQAEDTSDNKVVDPSHQSGQIKDKSDKAETYTNGEGYDTDQESSVSLESLSPSCYELEDVEEHEFEYLEVENKIDSFEGSIGFAIFRRKN